MPLFHTFKVLSFLSHGMRPFVSKTTEEKTNKHLCGIDILSDILTTVDTSGTSIHYFNQKQPLEVENMIMFIKEQR